MGGVPMGTLPKRRAPLSEPKRDHHYRPRHKAPRMRPIGNPAAIRRHRRAVDGLNPKPDAQNNPRGEGEDPEKYDEKEKDIHFCPWK